MKCISVAPDLSEDDVGKDALISHSRSAFEQDSGVCG